LAIVPIIVAAGIGTRLFVACNNGLLEQGERPIARLPVIIVNDVAMLLAVRADTPIEVHDCTTATAHTTFHVV
jgi:hypothetical protein